MAIISSIPRDSGARSRLTLPYRRPSYAKRLSDLTPTNHVSSKSKTSLNARYDRERPRTPLLRQQLGWGKERERGRGEGRPKWSDRNHRHVDWTSPPLTPDQQRWLDDLLSGKTLPQQSKTADRHHDHHLTPPGFPFQTDPYPMGSIPDVTSTPLSLVPVNPPSLSPPQTAHNPYLTPTPPVTRSINKDYCSSERAQANLLPVLRGILKNNHLKPFYPSSQDWSMTNSHNADSRVRFDSTLQERMISPAWSSTPSMASTETSQPQHFHASSRKDAQLPLRMTRQHQDDPPIPVSPAIQFKSTVSIENRLPRSLASEFRIPTPLLRAHQAMIRSRDSYTPLSTPRLGEPIRKAARPIITQVPVLQAFEESLRESPPSSTFSFHGEEGDDQSMTNVRNARARYPSPATNSEIAFDSEYGDTLVETDELNLRSVDGDGVVKADYIDHRNYPRQIEYEKSYSGSEYLPHGSDHSYYSAEPASAMRLTDAAWTFNVPKEVEIKAKGSIRQPRTAATSRKNARKEAEIRPRHQTQLTFPTDVPVGMGVPGSHHDDVARMDETLESISVFSDDPSEGEAMEDIQDVPERGLSPVMEEDEDAEETDWRRQVDEGFFAKSGEVGFKVWRDGY